MSNPIQLIILAAGKGTRMKSLRPKELTPLCGKPIIQYLLDNVKQSLLKLKPIIVVGYKAEEVMNYCGNEYQYVIQTEQLGTGHAVMQCEYLLKDKPLDIMVLYGDHPLIDPQTINQLMNQHIHSNVTLTMVTVTVPNFNGILDVFYHYGRIVRNEFGKIIKNIEEKDANQSELLIRETNPSLYCFNGSWLWKSLHNVRNQNAKKEYYLTDLVRLASESNCRISSVEVDVNVGLGVNTPE